MSHFPKGLIIRLFFSHEKEEKEVKLTDSLCSTMQVFPFFLICCDVLKREKLSVHCVCALSCMSINLGIGNEQTPSQAQAQAQAEEVSLLCGLAGVCLGERMPNSINQTVSAFSTLVINTMFTPK